MYQTSRFLSPDGFHKALQAVSGMTLARAKIYEMCESGEIRAWRNGTHWKIDVNEVDALPDRMLTERTTGVRPPHANLLGNKVEKVK